MLPSRVALLIPFITLFGASNARAQPYERTHIDGKPLCRGDRTLRYALTTTVGHPTAEERAAVTAAFNAWNQAAATCSDLVFEPAADVPHPAPPPRDGKTLVTFRQVNCVDVVPQDDACYQNESCADKYDCWDFAARDVVNAPVTFRLATGEILGAHISLNNSNGMLTTLDGPPCPQGVIEPGCVVGDVQSLVTRSIGEALGFALLTTRDDSTMSRNLPWGDTRKRVIDPGTLQGICELYPRGQPTEGCSAPTDGGSPGDDGGTPDGGDGVPGADGGTPDGGDGVPGVDGGAPDGGGGNPPDGHDGTPSKSGCDTTTSAPLLGALMLLLGARRLRRSSLA